MEGRKVRVEVCIICGRPAVIGPFCERCYKPKVSVERHIEVMKCKRCGKFRVSGEWTAEIKKLKTYLAKHVKGEDVAYVEVDLNTSTFIVGLKGANIEREYQFTLKYRYTTCPICSRIAGGYYEAIIQLRGNPARVREFLPLLAKSLERRTYITKEELRKEGVDLYVFSSKEAMKIVQELGVGYKLSKKLHGVRDGRRVYRLTIAIRFD